MKTIKILCLICLALAFKTPLFSQVQVHHLNNEDYNNASGYPPWLLPGTWFYIVLDDYYPGDPVYLECLRVTFVRFTDKVFMHFTFAIPGYKYCNHTINTSASLLWVDPGHGPEDYSYSWNVEVQVNPAGRIDLFWWRSY